MQLGWIDFSKEDRQKALDVINLLSEQGAVDELGIGIIRDAFANYFFPGTSTIQTRAKYFLIVPYVLREAVDGRYGKDVNRVLRAIDSAEKDCGIRLLEADPKAEGVIGTRVLPNGWVARKPSDIYWNGIRTFGSWSAAFPFPPYRGCPDPPAQSRHRSPAPADPWQDPGSRRGGCSSGAPAAPAADPPACTA